MASRPQRRAFLDTDFAAGDAIPVPEAIEQSGEGAWQLWEQANQAQDQQFADTEPMEYEGDPQYARTRPAGLQ